MSVAIVHHDVYEILMGREPYGAHTFEHCYTHFYRMARGKERGMLPEIIDKACTAAWSDLDHRVNATYNNKIQRLSRMVDIVAMFAIRDFLRRTGTDVTGRVLHNWNLWKVETGTWRIGCAHFCRAMAQSNTLPVDVLCIVAKKCRGCRKGMWQVRAAS